MGSPSALDCRAPARERGRDQCEGVMTAPVIPEGPEWQDVRDIFETHHLDPNNPAHWALLVKALAEMSEKKDRAGRPKQWEDDRLVHLGADFGRLRHKHPKKSESDICRLLAKEDK